MIGSTTFRINPSVKISYDIITKYCQLAYNELYQQTTNPKNRKPVYVYCVVFEDTEIGLCVKATQRDDTPYMYDMFVIVDVIDVIEDITLSLQDDKSYNIIDAGISHV